MNKKLYLYISLIIIFVITYIIIGFSKIEKQQNVNYLNKREILNILNNDTEYFDTIAEFYKNSNDKVIVYDLSTNNFVSDLSNTPIVEIQLIEPLFKKYSFNFLEKDGDTLSIYYQRPFEHKISIGLVYNYRNEQWDFLYNHNYEGCPVGHLDGYRIYDLIYN